MIVSRRPWLLYDVDAAGAVLIGAMLALLAWQGPARWFELKAEGQRIQAARAAARERLAHTAPALREAERGVREVEQAIERRIATAPRLTDLSRQVSMLTSLAREHRLDVTTLTPLPPVRHDAYDICSVQLAARGRLTEFAAFLDALALRSPYQELVSCSVARPPSSPDGACELTWTLNLYLLSPAAAAEEASES